MSKTDKPEERVFQITTYSTGRLAISFIGLVVSFSFSAFKEVPFQSVLPEFLRSWLSIVILFLVMYSVYRWIHIPSKLIFSADSIRYYLINRFTKSERLVWNLPWDEIITYDIHENMGKANVSILEFRNQKKKKFNVDASLSSGEMEYVTSNLPTIIKNFGYEGKVVKR